MLYIEVKSSYHQYRHLLHIYRLVKRKGMMNAFNPRARDFYIRAYLVNCVRYHTSRRNTTFASSVVDEFDNIHPILCDSFSNIYMQRARFLQLQLFKGTYNDLFRREDVLETYLPEVHWTQYHIFWQYASCHTATPAWYL